jgi:hypothetical protein
MAKKKTTKKTENKPFLGNLDRLGARKLMQQSAEESSRGRNHASTAWVPAVVGQAEVAMQPGLAHSDEKIVRPSATTYAFSFIRASKFPEHSVHEIAVRLWGNPIQWVRRRDSFR